MSSLIHCNTVQTQPSVPLDLTENNTRFPQSPTLYYSSCLKSVPSLARPTRSSRHPTRMWISPNPARPAPLLARVSDVRYPILLLCYLAHFVICNISFCFVPGGCGWEISQPLLSVEGLVHGDVEAMRTLLLLGKHTLADSPQSRDGPPRQPVQAPLGPSSRRRPNQRHLCGRTEVPCPEVHRR